MSELDDVLTSDGVMLTSPSGRVSVHPALVEYRQAAGTLPRLLSSIVIGITGEGANPVKSRAALTRWQRAHHG